MDLEDGRTCVTDGQEMFDLFNHVLGDHIGYYEMMETELLFRFIDGAGDADACRWVLGRDFGAHRVQDRRYGRRIDTPNGPYSRGGYLIVALDEADPDEIGPGVAIQIGYPMEMRGRDYYEVRAMEVETDPMEDQQ